VGQETGPSHALGLRLQSIVQVLVVVLHDVHAAGQEGAASTTRMESLCGAASIDSETTQKPSTHCRPLLAQSEGFEHA
jgi:hypothetical protein